MDRHTRLQDLVGSAPWDTMASGAKRKGFAILLGKELNLWEPPLLEFMQSMRGLNFRNREDRETFILFFRHAYMLDVV